MARGLGTSGAMGDVVRAPLSHREPSLPRGLGVGGDGAAHGAGEPREDGPGGPGGLSRNRSKSLGRLERHPGWNTARSTKSMKRPDDDKEYQLQVCAGGGGGSAAPALRT
jgi:hypothetical protein